MQTGKTTNQKPISLQANNAEKGKHPQNAGNIGDYDNYLQHNSPSINKNIPLGRNGNHDNGRDASEGSEEGSNTTELTKVVLDQSNDSILKENDRKLRKRRRQEKREKMENSKEAKPEGAGGIVKNDGVNEISQKSLVGVIGQVGQGGAK